MKRLLLNISIAFDQLARVCQDAGLPFPKRYSYALAWALVTTMTMGQLFVGMSSLIREQALLVSGA